MTTKQDILSPQHITYIMTTKSKKIINRLPSLSDREVEIKFQLELGKGRTEVFQFVEDELLKRRKRQEAYASVSEQNGFSADMVVAYGD